MSRTVVCPACGRPTAVAVRPSEYRYLESGLPNLWLKGGVTLTSCVHCKAKHIQIEKEAQLLQVVALTLLMAPRPLSGPEMRFIRGACAWSQAKLAEELKLERRETISDRERKSAPGIDFASEILLRLVLLRAFTAALRSPGNNHLPKAQRTRLARFTEIFVNFTEGFVKKMNTKEVAQLDEQGEWGLPDAA